MEKVRLLKIISAHCAKGVVYLPVIIVMGPANLYVIIVPEKRNSNAITAMELKGLYAIIVMVPKNLHAITAVGQEDLFATIARAGAG